MKRSPIHLHFSIQAALAIILSVIWFQNPLRAATFPPRAVVNVADYGANGSDNGDDTAAIQRAISSNLGSGATLYLPDGVYLVSDRLGWHDAKNNWWCFLSLMGQSRDKTIIRLKAHSPGFGDPKAPRAVIKTASLNPRENTQGADNDAYRNHIEDLTVEVEDGNPGAIGIDWNATNEGGLRNISIRARGAAKYGLALMWDSSPGPNFIGNLSVEGFDYGVYASEFYSAGGAIDGLNLRGQGKAGVYNRGMSLSIRALSSQNSVPVSVTAQDAMTTLIGARCRGGSSSGSAVETEGNGVVLARSIASSGYASALQIGGRRLAGADVAEYASGGAVSLFDSTARTLGLPVRDAPRFHERDLTKWANVEDFGARADDGVDDSGAIQRAIDSGATTIYFPTEKDRGGLKFLTRVYHIKKTVVIRGQVRRIWGGNCELSWPPSAGNFFADANRPQAFLRVENVAGPNVIIEKLKFINPDLDSMRGCVYVSHASPKTLVLRDVAVAIAGGESRSKFKSSYQNAGGAGDVFLEGVSGDRWEFRGGQRVWARMLNPEGSGTGRPKIINDGAILWILGCKTEGDTTFIRTINGGQTEVLGGMVYQAERGGAAFESSNSRVSYSVLCPGVATTGTPLVRETRGSQTRQLLRTDARAPAHHAGNALTMFSGHKTW